MKITKIKLKNAFGIEEKEINPGQITELSGQNGTGKTSVLDAIQTALNNKSPRTEIVKRGSDEALLYVETDSGLTIDRRKRLEKSDYKKISGANQTEEYLKSLFDESQFNPLKFIDMTVKEQNKVLLSLVEDNITQEQMLEWFGELPNLSMLQDQHILSKLDFLQSKQSPWYLERHEVNHKARHTQSTADDLLSTIPNQYDVEKWKKVDLQEVYGEITEKQQINVNIKTAEDFLAASSEKIENINNKYDLEIKGAKEISEINKKGIQSEIDCEIIDLKEQNEGIELEIDRLTKKLESYKISLKNNKDSIKNLEEKALSERSKEIDAAEKEKVAGIENLRNKDLKTHSEKIKKAEKFLIDNTESDLEILKESAAKQETMKSHAPNYEKAINYLWDIENLRNKSADLTDKIELARNLPGELLKKAKLPISGMKLENGVVKILNNNRDFVPVDNLSEGEKLELCIDIAVAKSGELKVILVDGIEKLDPETQADLIERAKKSDFQWFITKCSKGELEIKEY